jgi:hypothetical protein
LQAEIGKTERLFRALPTGREEFKPHEKSMTLGRLVGTPPTSYFWIALTLTMRNKEELLVRFVTNSDLARPAMKTVSDSDFSHSWDIKRGSKTLFSGYRFQYFRNQDINQIIYHRAQLGTYIRALDLLLPGMYGNFTDGI